jgi:small subunit ribosomal protein S8
MTMTDPLGDMLTRIRNAQMRKSSKVSTPGSALRKHVLDVLQSEGYIRGYSTVDFDNGRSEIEIELKYYDGEPVIREIQRVSRPGRRVYASVRNSPRVANDESLTLEDRFQARLKLAELPRNSSAVRIRNRCEISGRPRGVYRKLRVSRIALRDLGANGLIPGLVKSSW